MEKTIIALLKAKNILLAEVLRVNEDLNIAGCDEDCLAAKAQIKVLVESLNAIEIGQDKLNEHHERMAALEIQERCF